MLNPIAIYALIAVVAFACGAIVQGFSLLLRHTTTQNRAASVRDEDALPLSQRLAEHLLIEPAPVSQLRLIRG